MRLRLSSSLPKILAAASPLAALGVGATLGLGPALLVLAGSVLVLAVFLLWSSVERLSGESSLTFEEAMGLGAPTAEEERKRAVVRALKDLEYERSVGKISEEDFAELSARYRAEAKALLRSLDEGLAPLRKRAESLLGQRLAKLPPEETTAETTEDPSSSRASPPATPTFACERCGTSNDADARFCKHCAAPLSGASA